MNVDQRKVTTSRFEGCCYNCHKYGYRAHKCISKEKSNQTSKKQVHTPRKGNTHHWDYNTWYNFHYCGEQGKILDNYIKTNFKGNYKKWMKGEVVCFSCLKVGHISRNCRTGAQTPNIGNDKGKENAKVKKTWKKIV